MIAIKSLYKSFGEKMIFENYNENIADGEFVVFSGQSGCGKTTLLNMIGAIEKIDNGNIIVDGIDISVKKNHLSYFRNKIGFLFQNFALIENKTVIDNINLIKPSCRTELRIEDVLRQLNIYDKLRKKVYTLSGGEQQRVALARLMIKKCDIILADEPTGSLDKENAEIVIDILKKLNQQGKTIILVTHDIEIKKMGGRVINL